MKNKKSQGKNIKKFIRTVNFMTINRFMLCIITLMILLVAVSCNKYKNLIDSSSETSSYKIECSFKEEEKANKLFDQLKSEDFEPELTTIKDYSTENSGFIVSIAFEGKDKDLLARQTNKILEANDLDGSTFVPDIDPTVVKIKVGTIFSNEQSAKKYADEVFNKTAILFNVEPNIIITGEEPKFIVSLKTTDPFKAEDYKNTFKQKGFSPEMTVEQEMKGEKQ